MSASALLASARRWAAASQPTVSQPADGPDVLILGCVGDEEGASPGEDLERLLAAFADTGLRVAIWPDWCSLSVESMAAASGGRRIAVLPSMIWDYSHSAEAHRKFCMLMRSLCAVAAPAADLRGVELISHKRYLLELGAAGVPTVPTVLLAAGSGADELAAALRWHESTHAGLVDSSRTAGHEARFVIKPAVGGGGDGVEQIIRSDDASVAEALRLLRRREMCVQPFLPRVASAGELCFVFVNGAVLHAVRKDPALWSRGEAERRPADEVGEARSGGRGDGADDDDGAFAPRRHSCASQPVAVERSPPDEALAIAKRALEFARRRCGAELGAGFYLARVDLLPAGGVPEAYLVSEIEIGWPNLFLRARPEAAATVADGLRVHLENC